MLPSKIAHKTNEIPSEKTTETLFVSNAFHYLKTLYPHLQVSLFAPSQTDEDAIGNSSEPIVCFFPNSV
jgi:hypothetical protein